VKTDGTIKHLVLRDFRIEILDRWKSAKSSASYPMKWRVTVPAEELALEIVPAFSDQELITNRSTRVIYWEGAAEISGTYRNQVAKGTGYVEMTGYAGKLTL
jgi:predicted secreted hydrolase